VNFPIKLFVVVQQRKCVLQGRSHDLSEQGMAIYIPVELELGQAVQIEFTIPETNQRLGVNAAVRNSSGFRCGVEFRDLTPIDQAALHRHCEALSGAALTPERTEDAVPRTNPASASVDLGS
jgi:c-di-GMP-binding flagellar brake protein YcgR